MLLPLAQSWPVRCCKCGHTAVITAAVADLATRRLCCGSCGHRQPFAPETIVRAPRRPNGRKAREERRAAKALETRGFRNDVACDPLLDDRLDDVAWAG